MPVDAAAAAGSAELRRLYLDPSAAGVPWLLDPANGYVHDVLGSYESRRPDEQCDAAALAADIDDALVLIRQRHIGIAEGEFAGAEMERALRQWANGWRARLRAEGPKTWGEAIGTDGYRLRRVLGDSHCNVRGEDPVRVSTADPRADEPVLDDPGPAAEVFPVGDVLCVRLRRLGGSPAEIAQLEAWSGDHAEHFQHDRIVVDLRGNGGGGDQFALNWLRTHVPGAVTLSDEAYGWRLGENSLNAWNYGVQQLAMYGTPFPLRPDLEATLVVVRGRTTLAAGRHPWRGRMLVVTDRRVASAGESCVIFLRDAFGARVIGTPTAGLMLFGNIAPYVLPRSGLVLRLGTTRFGYPPVEFSGIPVDSPLSDPMLPLTAIADRFDQFWSA